MGKFIDLTGMRFGRLVVLKRSPDAGKGVKWICRCDCGNTTAVYIDIPKGYVGFLKSKSGLNVKHDLTSEGVIDAGYTGSICVKLYNHGKTDYKVNSGDKISQIVFIKVESYDFYPCSKMPERERGNAGFGSTGK